MKKSLIAVALLLSACTHLQTPPPVQPEQLSAEIDKPATDVTTEKPEKRPAAEINRSAKPEAEVITITQDMTFAGELPCADCPGISYHVNLFRDGRFEVRQEYLERGQINIVKGIWLLERRSLHLINQQQTLPAFRFDNEQTLTMLDLQGKPVRSSPDFQLNREKTFRKLDTRQAMLGIYRLERNVASFTSCQNGDSLVIANTQHHLPVMRQYQQDPRLNNRAVIVSLVGRKSPNTQGEENLYIDKFEQFWPGASCPDIYAPGKLQSIVWRAEKLADQHIPQQFNIRVIFEDGNKAYGFSGCNSFNASYTQESNQINVQNLASTRKFCNDDSSELEQRFTRSLQLADRAEVNGDKLQLFKNNELIMQFKPAIN